MRDGWRVARLGDVSDVHWGDTNTTKKSYTSTGFCAFSASGPDGFLPQAAYHESGVVVSAIGAKCGKTWLANGNWSCIKNTIRILGRGAEADVGFLYWALKDPSVWPIRGSAQPFIAQTDARNIRVVLPPMEEQRRIARVLGALGDLIDINELLASAASTLAKSLCATALSDVPLDVSAHVVATTQFQPTGMVDHYSIPVYDSSRLPERVEGSAIHSAKQRLEAPSVLVSRLNPQTSRVWMAYPSASVTCGASTEFLVLGPRDGVAVEEVWAVCSAPKFQEQMLARVTGTTGSHQRVDKAAIASLLVSDVRQLPSETRAAVVSLVKEAHESLVAARDLSLVRDELLPFLLTGAIRVDEVAV